MAITAYAFPGTATGSGWAASDAGTLVNALGTNDAIVAAKALTGSERLNCTNFGFSITSASIDAVFCRIEAYALSSILASGEEPYLGLQVTKDGTTGVGVELELAALGAPFGLYLTSTGYNRDAIVCQLQPGALSEAEVEAATFGVLVRRGPSSNDAHGRALDTIELAIQYSAAIVPPPAIYAELGDIDHIPGFGIIRAETDARKS